MSNYKSEIKNPPFSIFREEKEGFFYSINRMNYQKIRNIISSSGITLLELLSVIAIIAIISGVSLVSFTSLTGERLESDARKIVSDLTWARQMAVATHQDYIVDFDLINERYTIYRGSIAVNNQLKLQNLIADLVSVAPGPVQITFNSPIGTAQTQQINLSLQGKTRQVIIYGNTGFVKMQ